MIEHANDAIRMLHCIAGPDVRMQTESLELLIAVTQFENFKRNYSRSRFYFRSGRCQSSVLAGASDPAKAVALVVLYLKNLN